MIFLQFQDFISQQRTSNNDQYFYWIFVWGLWLLFTCYFEGLFSNIAGGSVYVLVIYLYIWYSSNQLVFIPRGSVRNSIGKRVLFLHLLCARILQVGAFTDIEKDLCIYFLSSIQSEWSASKCISRLKYNSNNFISRTVIPPTDK